MKQGLDEIVRIVIERGPWHTIRDKEPRYKHHATFTLRGVPIRSCRLSKKQVEMLVQQGVPVVHLKCFLCKKEKCTCLTK